MKAGQNLPAENIDQALEFLRTEDWGFVEDKHIADSVASNGDSMKKSYYCIAVARLLGWLVRNGCAIDRLDNHWECGVGSSGAAHTEQQPLHWNALHASIHVPHSVKQQASERASLEKSYLTSVLCV